MAKTLTHTVLGQITWDSQKNGTIPGTTKNGNNFQYSQKLEHGTGANQADLFYAASGTIAASGTPSLDLAGVLSDFFGDTITMARVKSIFIWITTDTPGSHVHVGGDANAFVNWVADASDEVVVRNGGVLLLAAPGATGYPVTAGTGDILKIENQDGSNVVTYNIAIGGASA